MSVTFESESADCVHQMDRRTATSFSVSYSGVITELSGGVVERSVIDQGFSIFLLGKEEALVLNFGSAATATWGRFGSWQRSGLPMGYGQLAL